MISEIWLMGRIESQPKGSKTGKTALLRPVSAIKSKKDINVLIRLNESMSELLDQAFAADGAGPVVFVRGEVLFPSKTRIEIKTKSLTLLRGNPYIQHMTAKD